MRNIFSKIAASDRDSLIKHSLIVMLFTHLGSASNLLFHIVMGRSLSPADYGVLATMMSIVLILTGPSIAFCNTVAHYTGNLLGQQRSGSVRGPMRLWLKRIWIAGLPILLLSLFLSRGIADFFHLGSVWPVVITCISVFLFMFIPVLAGALQGVQAFAWMSSSLHTWGTVRFVLAMLLVFFSCQSAETGLLALLAGVLCSLGVGIAGVHLKLPRDSGVGFEPESMERYFLLTLAALIGCSILVNCDNLIVKHYFSDVADYGPYARASTLGRMMFFLCLPLAPTLFPKVHALKKGTKKHFKILLFFLFIQFLMAGGYLLFNLLFPSFMLSIFYGVHDPSPEMIRLVLWVIVAMSPLGFTYILMTFEMAQHRFSFIFPLVLSALLFVGGAYFFHHSLFHIVGLLLLSSVFSVASLGFVTFVNYRKVVELATG